MPLPRTILLSCLILALSAASALGQGAPPAERLRELVDQAGPSLVIVKYVWEGEANRQELEGQGIVVSDDGLVMAPLDLVPVVLPDSQVGEFQILIPRQDGDPIELDATLQGRDERSNVVFIKANAQAEEGDAEGQTTQPVEWRPVEWSYERPQVGEFVVSVGRLPEGAGYTLYTYASRLAANLRGPVPLCVVDHSVTAVGSIVLDSEGRAVGLVERIGRRSPFLTGIESLELVEDRLTIFVPSEFYRMSLEDPPSIDDPVTIPFLGAERLTGLSQELREYYQLGDRAAIQVGDIIADSPAAEAEVNSGDVIVALNGEPLERGDTAEEQPEIFNRTLARMNVGDQVTLTLLDAARNEREVTATLAPRPKQVREAERWYAEDLGFSVRELVFADRYVRNLPADTPGVAVAFIREQSAAAAAGLRMNDLIRKLNQNDVQGLEDFRSAYEKFREENPNDPVVMEVLRGSETAILRIEPPR